MNLRRFPWPLLLALSILGCRGMTEQEAFVPLFNGVDLTGWQPMNAAPDTWSVRDSMIVCTGAPRGALRTDRQYENFIVELEWRHVTEGGNAGFFVHADAIPNVGSAFPRTIEAQIRDGNHGDLFSMQGAALVPDRPDPEREGRCRPSEERVKPLGEWNHYRIESRDGRVTLAVNGKVVSGGSQAVPRKGYLSLESEGAEVYFRNLRILELPSTNPPADQIAREDEGFRTLYTGVDLSGWLADEASGWLVEDYTLSFDPDSAAGPSPLLTTAAYEDFELLVDWRIRGDSTGAEAGAVVLRGESGIRVGIGTSASGSGSVSGAPVSGRADRPVGQWNRFVLSVDRGMLRIDLNGERVSEQPVPSEMPGQGPVGLVVEGTRVQFANLFLRPL